MLESNPFLEVGMVVKTPLGQETVLDNVVLEAEESIHYLHRAGSGSRPCHVRDLLDLCPGQLFPALGIDPYSD
jgi:hypothetical protein